MGNCVYSSQTTLKETKQRYIEPPELVELMGTPSNTLLNDYVIIDVRDELIGGDYRGGHVREAMNISDTIFTQQTLDIFSKYNAKKKLIIYDMYGVRRSIVCFQKYENYRKQIISNYSNRTQTSFYYKINDETDDANDGEPNQERVDINNCDQQMISNLSKQQVFVLKGGIFQLINSPYSRIIVDFDNTMWEQLELTALYEEKRWYHKNEYFAKAKFAELKKKTKSRKFRGFSSNDNRIAFLRESAEFSTKFRTYLA